MPNTDIYVSNDSGLEIDFFTKMLNNFKPQIDVIGLDPNTTVTCVTSGRSLSDTADEYGNCTFNIPLYAIWTITGSVSSQTKSIVVNVDKVRKYKATMISSSQIFQDMSLATFNIKADSSAMTGAVSLNLNSYLSGLYYLFVCAKAVDNNASNKSTFAIWKFKNGNFQPSPILQTSYYDYTYHDGVYLIRGDDTASQLAYNHVKEWYGLDANIAKTGSYSSSPGAFDGRYAAGLFLFSFPSYSEIIVDTVLGNFSTKTLDVRDSFNRSTSSYTFNYTEGLDFALVYNLYSTSTSSSYNGLNIIQVGNNSLQKIGGTSTDAMSISSNTITTKNGYSNAIIGLKSEL